MCKQTLERRIARAVVGIVAFALSVGVWPYLLQVVGVVQAVHPAPHFVP